MTILDALILIKKEIEHTSVDDMHFRADGMCILLLSASLDVDLLDDVRKYIFDNSESDVVFGNGGQIHKTTLVGNDWDNVYAWKPNDWETRYKWLIKHIDKLKTERHDKYAY